MREDITKSINLRILEMPHSENAVKSIIDKLKRTMIKPEFLVWQNYLLLDFRIFELCEQQGIPYTIKQVPFSTLNEALSWVCSNQLEREDLTSEYQKYLIGKKYISEINFQEEAQKTAETEYSQLRTKLPKRTKLEIASVISKDQDISRATVMKYQLYTSAIDRILKFNQNIACKILTGEIKVSLTNTLTMGDLSENDLKELCNAVQDSGKERISINDINEIKQRNEVIPVEIKAESKPVNEEPRIRQMPVFDPDSEISSLSLTIPSWVSSMERANKHTIYEDTSVSARINLIKELAILERTISIIQKEIEEAY